MVEVPVSKAVLAAFAKAAEAVGGSGSEVVMRNKKGSQPDSRPSVATPRLVRHVPGRGRHKG